MVSKKKIRLVMKKIALILVGLTFSLTTFAQGKYGATPKDSITCIESLIYKGWMGATTLIPTAFTL